MPLLLQLDLDEPLPEPPGGRSLLLPGMPDDLDEHSRHPFGKGLLQLFFCVTNPWRAKLPREDDNYDPDLEPCNFSAYNPFSPHQLARIIGPAMPLQPAMIPDLEERFTAKEIIGWERIDDYPCQMEGYRLAGAMARLHDQLFADDASNSLHCFAGHKLGGWPIWWQQGPQYPICPRCDRTMRLMIQLSANEFSFVFSRDAQGLLFQCPKHRGVLTFQSQYC